MPGSLFPGAFELNERTFSQPVHCYTFARGSTLWHYTDQPEDVTVSSVVYRAAVISHTEYARDDETAGAEIRITTSMETPIVDELDGRLDGRPITVTIRQTHRSGVGVVTPTTVVRFSGWVKARRLEGGTCEFTVASIAALLERPLLRWVCGPTCNKTVYGVECGVDPAAFTTTGSAITTISGRTLTVADAALQADGYYNAGYLVIESGTDQGEQAFIESHVGSSLVLLRDPPAGLTTADTIAITAGCDGLEATCDTKFSNIAFFGGFPRVPTVNPFEQAD